MSTTVVAAAALLFSSSTLFAVPAAGAAPTPTADVGGPITLDGTPVTVTISTAGQNGLYTFSGTSGQQVSVVVTGSTISPGCPALQVSLLRPDSSQLGSPASTCNANAFLDTQTLDASGTWTVFVDPQGTAKGHLTLQAYAVTDQTGPIVRNGVAVPVNITTPGQNARFTFSSSAGQQVSVYLTAATFTGACGGPKVSLVRPDGSAFGNTVVNCKKVAFLDSQTLDATGVWTILVDPQGTRTGTGNLQAFNTNDATGLAHLDGSIFAVKTDSPGQNAMIHFNGSDLQKVSALVTNATFNGCDAFKIALIRPNGTQLGNSVSSCTRVAFLDAQELDATGVWNILIDPQGTTFGTAKLQAWDATDHTKPITLNGAPVNIDLAPGQNGQYSFDGTNGQQVSAVISSSTITGCTAFELSLVRPNGTTLGTAVDGCGANAFLDSTTLDANGTWAFVVDPVGANSGTAQLNGYTFTDDNGAADLSGKPAYLNFNKPGQNAEWSFSGTNGQKVSAYVTESTLAPCGFTLSLVRPNGTTLGSPVHSCTDSAFLDTQILDQNGTWTVRVDPDGTNVGEATLQVFNIVDTDLPFKPGKNLKTFTVLTPGENALYRISGKIGDHRTLSITSSTYQGDGCPTVVASFLRPDGSVLTSASTCNSTLTLAADFDVAGTWTLFIDPQGPATGTMILHLT